MEPDVTLRMILDHEKMARIKNALRFHPKGMSITAISRELKLNRNSVAKYLEILLMSGHVDARQFGMSKIYSITDRVPVTALMRFTSDMILMAGRSRPSSWSPTISPAGSRPNGHRRSSPLLSSPPMMQSSARIRRGTSSAGTRQQSVSTAIPRQRSSAGISR